jgi:hypothetical protein
VETALVLSFLVSRFNVCVFYSFYFFVCHTKKVTKKVTAIVKFAKTVSLRAKNLNIAIKPMWPNSIEKVVLLHFSI